MPVRKPAKKKKPKKAARRKRETAWAKLSFRQAVEVIAHHLVSGGITPILTGSACAALYAPSIKAQSLDIIVKEYHVEKMEALMRPLGFRMHELRSFSNAHAPFEINFLAFPPTVGDEPVESLKPIKGKGISFKMLSPTDCVRHRLGVWYRWGDDEALAHAIAVARRHPVDQAVIKRWSDWEWSGEKYQEFLSALKGAP